MKKRLAVLIAVPATLAISAGAAFAVSAGNFDAVLHAVPHTHAADGGSDVNGNAILRLTGRTLDIKLSASGLTPGEPHAMHIHGKDDGELTGGEAVQGLRLSAGVGVGF